MAETSPPPAPSSGRRRRLGGLVVGIGVSGGALLWFLWGIDWPGLGDALARVHLPWVGLAALILLAEFGIRALRWAVLLRPLGASARVTDLFAAQVIGAACNTLLPLRAGEIAKPLVAARRTGHPLSAVVATAVMERVYDLFGLVSVLVVMVLVLPTDLTNLPPEEQLLVKNLKLYGGLFGLAAVVAMGIFFALANGRATARRAFVAIASLGPPPVRDRVVQLYDGFVAGLGNTRDPKGLLQAGLLSVGLWLNGTLAIAVLFRAFDMALPYGAACFTAIALALTVALPQAPGFVGVFHVAIEKTLVLWGQPVTPAKGYAIVLWAVSFLPVLMVGLAALWREGLDLATIRAASASAPPPPPAGPTA
ncbi:MAG: flippase-like domain-containing protein [Alphaproteobacteria bacterium]|nr:flippase-like domain-containing protein [Alphaproteobacteria bacterium]